MASSGKEFIVETEQVRRAVDTMNSIESDKFRLLLQRIALKIHSPQEASFKSEEIEKLEKSLSLSNELCLLVIDILEFIFLQAAFEIIKPAVLEASLGKIRLDEEKISLLVATWKENGKEIVEKIRNTKTISFRRLTSIKWRLNLQMACDAKSKQKAPNAIFEFGVGNQESVQVEFSRDQLYDFFTKLESIQKQIDSLSS